MTAKPEEQKAAPVAPQAPVAAAQAKTFVTSSKPVVPQQPVAQNPLIAQ